ncbi:hypothetical protein CLF_111453 [Clonorchis sinensis]|uniref:Uncharacterized protein n=1 Tax=Clonorchis sinensis TaxID=79923 RepID=G7YUX0_CLOSI|nr:hypothetical protein CLF_111453 [Clonorchis sinensis]
MTIVSASENLVMNDKEGVSQGNMTTHSDKLPHIMYSPKLKVTRRPPLGESERPRRPRILVLEQRSMCRRTTILVYFDLKGVLETADRPVLLITLAQRGMSRNYVDIVRSPHPHISAYIGINDEHSKSIPTKAGCEDVLSLLSSSAGFVQRTVQQTEAHLAQKEVLDNLRTGGIYSDNRFFLKTKLFIILQTIRTEHNCINYQEMRKPVWKRAVLFLAKYHYRLEVSKCKSIRIITDYRT